MLRRMRFLLVGLLTVVTMFAVAPAAQAQSAPDYSAAGSYAVGYVDTTVSAAGRSYSARVWYPAVTAGANTAVAPGLHPAIAFGHGFFQDISKYASTLRHWASWGMVVVAPKSQGGLFPNHSAFADDLNAGLTWLVAQNGTAGSRFLDRIDGTRLGLSGHSMGGGAALVAASRKAVTSVSTLAAAETNPSATTASAAIGATAQYVGGSNDTITPPSVQRGMYDVKSAPTQLRLITGGFHCGFTDSGGIGCDSGPMTRATQLALVRKVTTSWFLLTLRGDTAATGQVWGPAAQSDPQVTYAARR